MTIESMLKNKKILITGASSGIGRACAIFFSQQGAQLVLNGRNEQRLNETLHNLSDNNNFMIQADLSNHNEIIRLMDEAYSKVGALDGVVHSAGVCKLAPLSSLKESVFDNIFTLNVKSAEFLAQSFSRKNHYSGSGSSLIFLSSVAAVCGEIALSTYAASKAALQGLSKSLALELVRKNIRVNCIAPGHVETEMSLSSKDLLSTSQYSEIIKKHPLGLGRPEDIAHAAAFLMSDYSRWITGTTLYVDGGYSAH